MLRRFAIVCVILGLGACSRGPEAGLHVVIAGELQPVRDFDRISVISRLAESGTPLTVEVFEASSFDSFPLTLNLVSGPGTPRGTRVEVIATAELEGVVRSTVRGQAELVGEEGGRLELQLPAIPEEHVAPIPLEVCSNGLDDDADGAADCADSECDTKSCTTEGGLACQAGACTCPGGVVGLYAPRTGLPEVDSPLVTLVQSGAREGQIAIVNSPVTEVHFYNPTALKLDTVALGGMRTKPALASIPGGTLALIGGVGESSMAVLANNGMQFGVVPFDDPKLTCEGVTAVGLEGSVYLLGGRLAQGSASAKANAIIAVSTTEPGTHEKLGELAPSCIQSAAALGGSSLVTVGGCATGSTRTPSAQTTIAVDGQLQTGPTMPIELAAPALAELPGERALIIGGYLDAAGTVNARAFVIERTGDSFSLREIASPPQAFATAVTASLPNGWVYVAERSSGRAFWFDSASERFVPAPEIPGGRSGFSVIGLRSGAAFIVGGDVSGAPETTGYLVTPACQ